MQAKNTVVVCCALGTGSVLMDRNVGHLGQERVWSMATQMSLLGEVYMEVRDRKKLARLMIVQDETQRSLSAAAGWKSHSYLGRLLRGEVKTLDTDAAIRIAHKLRVPIDDLFITRVDSIAVSGGQRNKSTAA